MTVEQQVKQILSDASGFEVEDILNESRLTSDLELDSMDLLNLGNELEGQLDIEIEDRAINPNMTVQELVETIGKLL